MNFVYDFFKSVIIEYISHHMLPVHVCIALSLVYTMLLCQILRWCIFSRCNIEGGREGEGGVCTGGYCGI